MILGNHVPKIKARERNVPVAKSQNYYSKQLQIMNTPLYDRPENSIVPNDHVFQNFMPQNDVRQNEYAKN